MDATVEETVLGRQPDFPDSLGPVLVKELRQGMRARRFVVPFVLIHFVMIWALFADIAAVESGYGHAVSYFISLPGLESHIAGQSAYWFAIGVTLLLVVPLTGIGLLEKEKNGGNVELLLMAGLSRWQVVRGQWLVLCLQGGLIFLATIPYLMVRYSLIGGFNVAATIASVFGLVCMHSVANALAVALSGYSKLITRILIGGLSVPSILITSAGITGATAFCIGQAAGITSVEAALAVSLLGFLLASLFFTVNLLQLGRARIRLFEKPYEPPQSQGMALLIILSPLIFGLGGLMTVGWGIVPLALLLTWTGIITDRSLKRKPVQKTETEMDEPPIRI